MKFCVGTSTKHKEQNQNKFGGLQTFQNVPNLLLSASDEQEKFLTREGNAGQYWNPEMLQKIAQRLIFDNRIENVGISAKNKKAMEYIDTAQLDAHFQETIETSESPSSHTDTNTSSNSKLILFNLFSFFFYVKVFLKVQL